ncbi:PHP domain-containing protein [Methanocaldococcus villosus KIN24-T80]|uniref:PHP domain-containing protein n=1 Tax=Methanocaldococcus villosus KIN24-T80 TaxID=1069083 RepID=N6VU08_9EURY|nr:PHP domain-containing protein [Methanocaldococcus villosus]ENN96666.1 PHP domain-containing protein [Methanocaldococcus villosus KIN24-T80]
MKADLHIHTKYSGISKFWKLKFPDSVEEPKNILKVAKKKRIDIVAITDHNTIRGGLETKKIAKDYGVEVIVGSEIMSKDGEIIGLFLNEEIPKGLSAEETIERIKEQGGLAIAPHPYSPICKGLGDKIFSLDLDGVEVFNAYHRDGIINNIALSKVIKNYHKKRYAFIGGSDAHIAMMVGNAYTLFEGNSADDLYKAIKKKETTFSGNLTPLYQAILWSYKVVLKSEKMIISSLFFNGNDYIKSIKLYKKLLAMFGGFLYIFTPLPIFSGFLGNYYLKRLAKKKMKNYLLE